MKEFTIRLKRFSSIELQSLLQTPTKKYNLRSRHIKKNETQMHQQTVKSKQIVNVSVSNSIWHTLTSHTYQLYPTNIVLAKMASFRPWPARINSIYTVGKITKCYVLFYRTFQIGSVLKSQCVRIGECEQYLFHTVKEIKSKYKWDCDYECISKLDYVQKNCFLRYVI